MRADGKVYLVNPQGVVIGKTGRINTGGGFTASTLDVADADFMAGGAMRFRGDSGASVVNHGKIRATEGDVMLIARRVENHGRISARRGEAHLAAGQEVLVQPAGTTGQRVFIRTGGGNSGSVGNTGLIRATAAELRAAGGNEYALAVNNTGVIRATGVDRSGGRIVLKAEGQRDVASGRGTAGSVRNSGRLIARGRAPGKAGGSITVTGDHVTLASGSRLDAGSTRGRGGAVRVGGGFQGRDASISNARTTTVEAGAEIAADGPAAGGTAIVWSDEHTSFLGSISARGTGNAAAVPASGGFVEVSGKQSLQFRGTVDTGGGTLLLDPATLEIINGGSTTLGDSTLDAMYLVSLLDQNHVTLQASESITVNSPFGTAGNAYTYNLTFNTPRLYLNELINLKTGATMLGTSLLTEIFVGANGRIQNAIDAAPINALAVIRLLATTYTQSININKAVTIDGGGTTTISGGGTSRVVRVSSSGAGTVTLSNLTIADGFAVNGAGIQIDAGATVLLQSATVRDNRAYQEVDLAAGLAFASTSGGGIFNAGNLTIRNSVIRDNKAESIASTGDGNLFAFAMGGGIADGGTLRIYDSEISGNKAIARATSTSPDESDSFAYYAQGGGIYTTGAGPMIIERSSILNNTAETVAERTRSLTLLNSRTFSTNTNTSGGGIYIFDNTVTPQSHSITDTTIRGNSAQRGGGIYVGGGTLNMTSGSVVTNTAASRELRIEVSTQIPFPYNYTTEEMDGRGAGIYSSVNALLSLNGTDIAENTIILQPLTIGGNADAISVGANTQGGGVYSEGALQIRNATIRDNVLSARVVTSGTSASSASAQADGAGVYHKGGSVLIQDSTFSGNSATAFAQNGSSVSSSTPSAGAGSYGGGLYFSNAGSTLTVERSRFTGNSASATSVKPSSQGTPDVGFARGGGVFSQGAGFTVTASTFDSNSVTAAGTMTFGRGGGLYHEGTGPLIATNATFTLNSAVEGGGIYLQHNSGIHSQILSSTIARNSATNNGGGIVVTTLTGLVEIGNTIVSINTTGNINANIDGTFADLGLNLINHANPRLTPLGDFGGPTPTLALLPGSPALNSGSTALTIDQRGAPRGDGLPDIGAYESRGFAYTLGGNNQSTPLNTLFAPLTVTLTALDPGIFNFSGIPITLSTPGSGATAIGTLTHTLSASGTATFNLTAAGALGTYSIGIHGVTGLTGNFTLTNTGQPITILPDFGQGKIYGDPDGTLLYDIGGGSSITLNGLLLRAAGEDAGSYLFDISQLITLNPNYVITLDPSSPLYTITPRSLTVAPSGTLTKVYGSTTPAFSYSLISGSLQFTDTMSSVFTGGLNLAPGEAAGTYAITQGTLTANANYQLVFNSGTFSITPAILTVRADNASGIAGSPLPPFSGTVAGFQFSDTESAISGLTFTSTATAGSPAGDYIIIGSGASAANYIFQYIPGTLTLTSAPNPPGQGPGGNPGSGTGQDPAGNGNGGNNWPGSDAEPIPGLHFSVLTLESMFNSTHGRNNLDMDGLFYPDRYYRTNNRVHFSIFYHDRPSTPAGVLLHMSSHDIWKQEN